MYKIMWVGSVAHNASLLIAIPYCIMLQVQDCLGVTIVAFDANHAYWAHCDKLPAEWEQGERLWLSQVLFRGEIIFNKTTERWISQ